MSLNLCALSLIFPSFQGSFYGLKSSKCDYYSQHRLYERQKTGFANFTHKMDKIWHRYCYSTFFKFICTKFSALEKISQTCFDKNCCTSDIKCRR